MNSVSEFSYQPKAENAGSGNAFDEQKSKNLINLNQVFQTSLELYKETINKSAPVIRCDTLPFVYGDSVQMLKLFNLLFKMVLLNLPATTNLFIYIKCELEKEDVIDMTMKNGINKFNISLFSNTIHIKEWLNNFQQELAELKKICFNFSGSFKEHSSSQTGCLFTICLPGKIN
jgi:hypothetical protein